MFILVPLFGGKSRQDVAAHVASTLVDHSSHSLTDTPTQAERKAYQGAEIAEVSGAGDASKSSRSNDSPGSAFAIGKSCSAYIHVFATISFLNFAQFCISSRVPA